MKEIIVLFWDICRFKRGPESVPAEPVLAGVVFLGYLLTTLVAIGVSPGLELSFFAAFFVVVATASVTLGLVWVLLFFKGVTNRYIPTVIALVGADVVLTVLGLPLIVALEYLSFDGVADLLGGLLILLMGWSIVVGGFIFHRALSMSLMQGSFISICIMVSSNYLASFLMASG
ncbi:MAG: hypothetical protein COB51_08215 [Moraxellaceae bacterium]|nr:MAG: hypothetical protein COB51_08215 [Moraxellaceae bacterium]